MNDFDAKPEEILGNRLSRSFDSMKTFVGKSAATAAYFIGSPYAIPSFIREYIIYKKTGKGIEIDLGSHEGTTGLIAGSLVSSGIGFAGGYALAHGHAEVLLIPVATNAVSGIYELGRLVFNKNASLQSHDNSEGIEDVL